MADENNTENISEEEAGEDVPSNFFDDFEKDDFLKGLEVIDSLHDDDGRQDKNEDKRSYQRPRRSASSSRLDDYIKPGSRRDPEKTNAAIRRDKEVKVKEHLAKHLESQDDIRPPGTELDDYYDESRPTKIKKRDLIDLKYEIARDRKCSPKKHDNQESSRLRSPPRYLQSRGHRGHWRGSYHGARHAPNYYPRHAHRYSRGRSPRHSPRRSPKFVLRQSPRCSPPRSPKRSYRRSPRRSPRNSPPRSSRHSPLRNSRYGSRISPRRSLKHSPRHSPRQSLRHSPRRSQQRDLRSDLRSSRKRSTSDQSPHWSPRRSPQLVSSQNDHYNNQQSPKIYSPQFSQPQYNPEIPHMSEQYVYTFNEAYNHYTALPGPEMAILQPGPPGMEVPQPVPMPINPVPPPMMSQPSTHFSYIPPDPVAMVPPPQILAPELPQAAQPLQLQHVADVNPPHDALAQLVAEGKLSKEDYLKLTPSIKGGNNWMDVKTKNAVLTRCNQAVKKLNNLINPFRFWIEDNKCSNELLSLPQKYASPLKRQVPVEFEFTKPSNQIKTQNKQLINNIVATIGLEKAILRTKVQRDVKSVGVQTTKPYCDMCDIRESTKKCSVGVSTDHLFLTNTVHTQVVEQDLLNSKAIFNPTGSVGDGAPISIAHLTPAQLVSQLAARAKSFQQAEPPPASNQLYPRRNPPNSYDGRGGAHHFNQNYRYHY